MALMVQFAVVMQVVLVGIALLVIVPVEPMDLFVVVILAVWAVIVIIGVLVLMARMVLYAGLIHTVRAIIAFQMCVIRKQVGF